jgi:hypothetical protein
MAKEDPPIDRKPSEREVLTVRLSEVDARVLDAMCQELNMTKSDGVRTAIRAYVPTLAQSLGFDNSLRKLVEELSRRGPGE